jgi:hypothetical protein
MREIFWFCSCERSVKVNAWPVVPSGPKLPENGPLERVHGIAVVASQNNSDRLTPEVALGKSIVSDCEPAGGVTEKVKT